MDSEEEKYKDIDNLLKGVFTPDSFNRALTLRERFEQRLAELKLTPRAALHILEIERRSLNGLIDGTQKRVDFVVLSKLAQFLQLTTMQLVELYVNMLAKNFKDEFTFSEKRTFIFQNFDLVNLKKAGFIDSIHDFDQIEKQLTSYFGISSIFDYKPDQFAPAYSASAVKPKNDLTRKFWINSAAQHFRQINNVFEFERKALIEYFPKIRWHSTNVSKGLVQVVRALFKIGITVIFQPSLPSLHLRGATFAIHNKPCIVITDYKGYYPTLWFALIHELYHVLFDWEEVKINSYHLSDEQTDLFTVEEKEVDANNFARQYLFSNEKMAKLLPYIDQPALVNAFAAEQHVHASMIYVFNAFDEKENSTKSWARAQRHMPDISQCLKSLVQNPWQERKPIKEVVKQRRLEIFNSLST